MPMNKIAEDTKAIVRTSLWIPLVVTVFFYLPLNILSGKTVEESVVYCGSILLVGWASFAIIGFSVVRWWK